MQPRVYFNFLADQWDAIITHDPQKLQRIVDLAGLSRGDQVLDVGTGTGVLLPLLLEKVGQEGHITAIDVAEKMIEVAKAKHRQTNIVFVCGDVLAGNLPARSHDCIMCYSVFPHFDDKKAAVQRLGSLLRAGGRLVIAHSQGRTAINHFHDQASSAVSNDMLPTMATIQDDFRAAGLEPKEAIDDDYMFVAVAVKR